MRRFRPTLLLPVAMISAALGLAPVAPASAAELVTPYPSVRVEPGQDATFDLQIFSDEREPVELRVTDAPDGWETLFRGDGREIDAVYANPGEAAEAQLDVRLPADAEPGRYDVTVVADAPSGDSRLELGLRVVEQASGAFEFGTDFDTLRGSGTDTYRFDLTVANNTAQEATFSLAASGPEGWNVTASPSTEQQAATVTVDAGSQSTVTVEADPPDDVAAGSYEIGVEAQGEGTTLQSTLTAEVTGAGSMTLSTAGERLNASGSAGDSSSLSLVVTNDGNAPLQGVTLSSTPPTDWEVTFEPETVEVIPPGQSAQVTANITPDGDAIAGDYVVTFDASSQGESSGNDSVEVRYTVETSAWWGLLGVLVIVAALAALFWVYRRFGRR
ncbi:COG1470 family protein [Phytoactinopolyspora halotolerans]|uniref:Alpha-galactosidase NEW3 domain-containing protein n=1 Tax=Phytoactinopolyspora halotolerans TaxID=1981512 RepID=A0A6L9SGQ6_9ACTN|nr:NEW3 domain-containing protein [Phytoactinopolyspora halotolerans]NEE03612.1 hypothetical protein [Phytoactinopolyspora halotolerans]